jgi:uncharacterized damage-inducible protein DinB
MFRTVEDFATQWTNETKATQRTFDAITDESLSQPIQDDHRTLGRVAWHVAGTVKEMMERTGLKVDGPAEHDPVPATAKEIAETFARSAQSLADAVKTSWTDDSLNTVDNMYGEEWSRGQTLLFLMMHQAHHRGQMNVLMRQAGLRAPAIYGPAKEDWANYQMEPPII